MLSARRARLEVLRTSSWNNLGVLPIRHHTIDHSKKESFATQITFIGGLRARYLHCYIVFGALNLALLAKFFVGRDWKYCAHHHGTTLVCFQSAITTSAFLSKRALPPGSLSFCVRTSTIPDGVPIPSVASCSGFPIIKTRRKI